MSTTAFLSLELITSSFLLRIWWTVIIHRQIIEWNALIVKAVMMIPFYYVAIKGKCSHVLIIPTLWSSPILG
jgi:hypothetical protein